MNKKVQRFLFSRRGFTLDEEFIANLFICYFDKNEMLARVVLEIGCVNPFNSTYTNNGLTQFLSQVILIPEVKF